MKKKKRNALARIIRALLLAPWLVFLLTGCSAIKLGYNAAPQAIYWWLDGYVDFSETQSQRVREDLARLEQWHRRSELPRYVALLQRVEALGARDITAAQACSVVEDVRARLDVLAEQAEPAVMALASSLSPRQLQHIERKYAKENARYREEWIALTPAERREKRLKDLVDRGETIYGRLEDAQREAILRELEHSIFDPQRILAERQRRQQDLLARLRKVRAQGTPPEEARRLMRGYLERVRHSPDAAYAAYQDALIRESCAAFAAAHNSTSAAQREAAGRRLRAYQRDLTDLAAS